MASIEPLIGQDSSGEVSAVRTIVEALQRSVQGRRPNTAPETSAETVEPLEAALCGYLAQHRFLRLRVRPEGLLFRGVLVLPGEQVISNLLWMDEIIEVLFKQGVTQSELGRCVEAMHLGSLPGATRSVATRLWEAELPHIVFRCADELPSAPPAELQIAPHRGVTTQAASGSAVHLDAAGGSAAEQTNGIASVPPDETSALAALRPLRLPLVDDALRQLALQLLELQRDPNAVELQPAALELLGALFEALVVQRKLVVARDLLRTLQRRVTATPSEPAQSALQVVVATLCRECNILSLGAVLDDPEIGPADAAAVRDLLGSLQQSAVDPLCTLLLRLENMQARKLVCNVLAAVAGSNPGVLAHRAASQPWYVARNMAYVLGRIGGPEVLPYLRRWARHEEPRVRIEVARALGKVRQSASTALLCELLDDSEARVRQSAVWSLATIGDAHVLPRLRQVLFEDRTFRSRRTEERDDFFRTYGRLADDTAYQELARLVEQRRLVGVGWHVELRRGAALALGEMARPEAAQLLRERVTTRDTRLREACQAALRAMKNRGLAAASVAGADPWHDADFAPGAPIPDVALLLEDPNDA